MMDMQMAVSAPSGWYVSSTPTFKVVKADHAGNVTLWVTPGWYRRVTSPDGVISLIPMRRRRLWRHRIMWGFSGLVDGR